LIDSIQFLHEPFNRQFFKLFKLK